MIRSDPANTKPTDFWFEMPTSADAHAVSELLRRAFLDFEERYAPQAFLATVPPEDGVLARLSEGPIWVAERQSTLIGTVSVVHMQDSVMVPGMAVDPGARGPWNGKILLDLTENFAEKYGYEYLSLYTAVFLKQAIHLYQASGFQFTGETANPHGTELLRMKGLDRKCGRGGQARDWVEHR